MPPSSLTADIERLQASATSLLALISHCRSSLSGLTTTARASESNPFTAPTVVIPPLSLLHDTASLAKAHTTKLALLLTQATLSSTCRAITPILSTIQTSVLPPLLTSLELLSTNHHGKALHHAVSRPISEILHGIEEMVGGPLKTMVDSVLKRGADAGREEPSGPERETIILPSTGKIWGACDKLMALKAKGLNGVVKERLQSSDETIKDASEELATYYKAHTLGSSTGNNAGGSDEVGDEGGGGDDDDDPFWDSDDDFPPSTPPNLKKGQILHPEVARAIDASTKRFKAITILFQAIQKSRLTATQAPQPDPALTTKPNLEVVKRLDGMVNIAEEMVVLVDEVVGEYYEHEFEDIDPDEYKDEGEKKLSENEKSLVQKAVALANLAQLDWEGSGDARTRLFEELAKAVQR
ncbi:hypothetical protein EV426DRAFT_588249 [Tirmania nivea]|nr:hypothetical protein EV426DRAFT_588249 [Tirmania nivea]